MSYKIKKFLMSNGERGCLILDKETQLPVYYQNLYLTTNVRNRSATASTIEIVATNLLILSNFLKSRNINIINRIEIKGFLSVAEVDDLIRYARQRFDKQKITNVRVIKMEQVAKRTFSYRIHVFRAILIGCAVYFILLREFMLDMKSRVSSKVLEHISREINHLA